MRNVGEGSKQNHKKQVRISRIISNCVIMVEILGKNCWMYYFILPVAGALKKGCRSLALRTQFKVRLLEKRMSKKHFFKIITSMNRVRVVEIIFTEY